MQKQLPLPTRSNKYSFHLHIFAPEGATKPKKAVWFEKPRHKNTWIQIYSAKSKDDALRYFKRSLAPKGCELSAIYFVSTKNGQRQLIEMSTEIGDPFAIER